MLSYQHGYHAGNFADVIKHISLTRLLAYLTQKDKPLFYLETHSGKGLYHLKDRQAEKTGEYKEGIQPIWDNRNSLPTIFKEYIHAIKRLNETGFLNFYPGSPYLALQALRPQDRAYFCELHPAEFEALAHIPRFNKKAHLSNTDGIAALNALLPPPEKRGLIFIDPSFEIKEEYKQIPLAIKRSFTRFATGVYCLWYPVVNKKLTEQLIRGMKEIKANNAVRVEFNLTLAPKDGMTGCGLWIINPPYTFAAEIKTVLDTLRTYFNPGISSYIVETHPMIEK
ncbi:23S rRNA (adenine(2030)-N(6))-methyltransferase RlmJ [Legionella fallonii]|uniref:Ribosomal RNA large subunit methyltransferase J n=1 Tax=Legionella fallonii LLAP-10 TaxID=1212491 RepID=A0A098G3W3_9GAMM|nr:23S rRNA (adenine(2030)-N(6))-methyltransferase RlmJ [Legionella fallonii]CEG56669.1 Ribosomal RNA large subunit methyltransferase J [Legionella fallonii LLAP-10]